jgi:hypothetical protein
MKSMLKRRNEAVRFGGSGKLLSTKGVEEGGEIDCGGSITYNKSITDGGSGWTGTILFPSICKVDTKEDKKEA